MGCVQGDKVMVSDKWSGGAWSKGGELDPVHCLIRAICHCLTVLGCLTSAADTMVSFPLSIENMVPGIIIRAQSLFQFNYWGWLNERKVRVGTDHLSNQE